MKKNFARAALTASLLCSVTSLALISPAVAQISDYSGSYNAADQDKKQKAAHTDNASNTSVTNPVIGKALRDAQKAIQANDFATAATDLKAAQAVSDPTPIETYDINKFVLAIAIGTKDYAAATAAVEANAQSPLLQDADKHDVYFNGMVLETRANNYQKTIEFGKNLESINALNAEGDAVVAVAYYNLKDVTNAKVYAQKSLDAAKAAGQNPEQAALEIMMNSQVDSHNTAGAIATLEQIAVQHNNPDDWRRLTDIGLDTKGLKPIDVLYIYRLKDAAGGMESDDYITSGEEAAFLGYPVEAVKFFEEGVNSGKAKGGDINAELAKARNAAAQDEHNLSVYATSAAKSKTGEQDIKMAEDYWGRGRYADAEASARSAIAKGGLKDPTQGQMILGMSLFAQNKYDEAVQIFGQVSGNEGRSKAAHLWSLYAQAKKNQGGGSTAATAPPAK